MRKLRLFLILAFASVVAQADTKPWVVAKDGSGDFKTVQAALDAVPDFRKVTTVIYLKNGTYKEKLILPGSKKLVKLVGQSAEKTILDFDNFATRKNIFGEEMGTSGSASFYIYGDDFTAENLTFQNSAGPVGQAVACWVAGDRAAFINCRFLGFQDTLYTYGAGSREFYYKCYIEGTVDFIFGSATAWFEECEIVCKRSGYITAASTPDTTAYGYVFNKCRIRGDSPGTFYLGRPWRPFAKTVFIECDLGDVIRPEGWNNWSKESNERTAFYAEYKSKGPGAHPQKRVSWSHQLSDDQAKAYTPANVLRGWNPHEEKKP